MYTLWSDFDRLFNNSLENWFVDPRFVRRSFTGETASTSRMNLLDKGDNLEFVAELPGVEEKDMNLSVHNDTLTLKAKRTVTHDKENSIYLAERGDFDMQRSIALPVRVEADKAKATFKNGILDVVLPKAPESKPRQISINA